MARKTKTQKRQAVMEMLGIDSKPIKKVRKKRKPMTPEQKAAASERLAKAREARGPTKNLSIDESIRDLDLEHPLHPNKVKEWIKEQKQLLQGLGKEARDGKDSGLRQQYWNTDTYIFNLQRYLNDGVYRDNRYGAERQNKISMRCVGMAYYADGTPKRTPGVYYPDLGCEYTKDMALEDNANKRKEIPNKKRVRKTN